MKANLYWTCPEPGCGLLNLSPLDTAKPRLDLVCQHCGQAAHVRATLENYVHDRIGPPVAAKEEQQ